MKLADRLRAHHAELTAKQPTFRERMEVRLFDMPGQIAADLYRWFIGTLLGILWICDPKNLSKPVPVGAIVKATFQIVVFIIVAGTFVLMTQFGNIIHFLGEFLK